MDRPIVITGASSGIGYYLALRCVDKGIPVVAIARREAELKALQAKAAAADMVRIISADLATESGRELVIDSLKDVPQLRALVHNAGTIQPIAALQDIELEAWRLNQTLNVEAPLFLTQGLLDQLNDGRILHISSGAAHQPFHAWGAYCIAKAALFMLYKQANLEFVDRNIAVASVMPGIVDTDMQASIRNSKAMPEAKAAYFRLLSEKNKLVSPDTVAKFLLWILTEVDKIQFVDQEWDIYDKTHHSAWLGSHSLPKYSDGGN